MTRGRGQFTTRITDRIAEDFLRDSSVPTRDVIVRLLLFDFETGEAGILEQHDAALQRYIVPQIAGDVRVWVGGMASRLGDERGYDNRGLSFSRASQVARRIEFGAPQVRTGRRSLTTASFGSSRSLVGGVNSPYYRSVLVVVGRMPAFRLPPEPARPVPVPFSNRFKIRTIRGIEGGEIIAEGEYRFEIDFESSPPGSQLARYKLHGFGGTVGSPISGTGGGPWHYFDAQRNCLPSGFEGRASIGGYGVFGHMGSTTLYLFPRHGPEISIRDFNTGPSGAVGISRIYGPLERYE